MYLFASCFCSNTRVTAAATAIALFSQLWAERYKGALYPFVDTSFPGVCQVTGAVRNEPGTITGFWRLGGVVMQGWLLQLQLLSLYHFVQPIMVYKIQACVSGLKRVPTPPFSCFVKLFAAVPFQGIYWAIGASRLIAGFKSLKGVNKSSLLLSPGWEHWSSNNLVTSGYITSSMPVRMQTKLHHSLDLHSLGPFERSGVSLRHNLSMKRTCHAVIAITYDNTMLLYVIVIQFSENKTLP